jgi:(3,5-dihydroxyphenyl)acetyl-CoA 1,2-dioxygenase
MKLRSITTKLSVSAQITPTDLDAIAPPTEMDAAIDRVVERLTSAGAVSAIGNRRVFRVGQEPLDLFGRYASFYGREQAYCHFSPALITNLERSWGAKNRRV